MSHIWCCFTFHDPTALSYTFILYNNVLHKFFKFALAKKMEHIGEEEQGTNHTSVSDSSKFKSKIPQLGNPYKTKIPLNSTPMPSYLSHPSFAQHSSLLDSSQITNGNGLKYIVDPSLPGIARHLLMMGIDCAFEHSYTSQYIMFLARKENRIIITRSTKLVHKLREHDLRMNKILNHQPMGNKKNQKDYYDSSEEEEEFSEDEEEQEVYFYTLVWVNSLGRKQQLVELVNYCKLIFDESFLFSRCFRCNHLIHLVPSKDSVKGRVLDNVFAENCIFAECEHCKKLYWGTLEANPGSGYAKAVEFCTRFSYPAKEVTPEEELNESTSFIVDLQQQQQESNKELSKRQKRKLKRMVAFSNNSNPKPISL